MCGRYQFSLAVPELRKLLERTRRRFPTAHLEMAEEIFPTSLMPVLMREQERVMPQPIRWGDSGAQGKGMVINACSETAAEKPMFRTCLAYHRCVVPTSGFFEWSHDAKIGIPAPSARSLSTTFTH